MTPSEIAEVINAFVAGKPVEYQTATAAGTIIWKSIEPKNYSLTALLYALSQNGAYRVRPEEKTVPLDASDFVGKTVWLRFKGAKRSGYYLVERVGDGWVKSYSWLTGLTYKQLQKELEYTLDGKTWHACEKKV